MESFDHTVGLWIKGSGVDVLNVEKGDQIALNL
jgi:hypothetical protein